MKSAIIGFGYWGEKIYSALERMGEDFGVYDLDISRTKALKDVRVYESLEELLDDKSVQCVFIATPPMSHAELIERALCRGKHVFAEKPLSLDSKSAQKLLQKAQDSSLVLHVDHIFLYSPAVLWIRENLSQIGEVFSVECARLGFGRFDSDVDALYDLGLHDVSILEFLLSLRESEIDNVRQERYLSQLSPNASHVKTSFRARSADFNITSSWLFPRKVRKIIFYGHSGMIAYDDCAEDKIIFLSCDGSVMKPKLDSKMPLNSSIGVFFDKVARKQTKQDSRAIRVMEILERIK